MTLKELIIRTSVAGAIVLPRARLKVSAQKTLCSSLQVFQGGRSGQGQDDLD